MKARVAVAVLVAGVGLGVCTSHATNHYVSVSGSAAPPYLTWATAANDIQSAIGVCGPDDVVIVTNGTWTFSKVISVTNRVTLRSENGRDVTTLDGQNTKRCVTLFAAGSVLEGFTVRRGKTSSGGGVYLCANTTVRDCIVQDCETTGGGGGLSALAGSVVEDCLIRNNKSRYGGGVEVAGASVLECTIYDNQATEGGGGVDAYSSAQVASCIVRDNTAKYAAGVYALSGVSLRNLLVYDNAASEHGGGIGCKGGTIESCTVVDNTAATVGGGIEGCTNAFNTIAYHNTAAAGVNWAPDANGHASYRNCCTFPAAPGLDNIDMAPAFSDRPGDDYTLVPGSPCIDSGAYRGWMAGATDLAGTNRVLNGVADRGCYEYAAGALDVGLTATPAQGFPGLMVVFQAVAAGDHLGGLQFFWDFQNNGSWDATGFGLSTVTNTYPAAGYYSVRVLVSNNVGEAAARVVDDCVRVGPQQIYVVPVGSGAYPFDSWTKATDDLGDALGAAVDGSTINVSNGNYNMVGVLDVRSGVTIRGTQNAADSVLHQYAADRVINLLHPGAVVEKLTIQNGEANLGGGVCMAQGGVIRDCIIRENAAAAKGGGVYLFEGGVLEDCLLTRNEVTDSSSMGGGAYCEFSNRIDHCRFTTNICQGTGGGIYAQCGGTLIATCGFYTNWAWHGGGIGVCSNIVVRDCDVRRNYADGQGGGIYIDQTCCVIDGCAIANNASDADGGGINIEYGCNRLLNSMIQSNHSDTYGGGIYVDYGPNLIEGCTVAHNRSEFYGGGAYLNDSRLNSSRIEYNSSGEYGGGIYADGSSLTNCLIVHNGCADDGGGVYLYGGYMHSCTVADNVATNQGGGVYDDSYVILNSIVFNNTCLGAFFFRSNHVDSATWFNSCTLPLPTVSYSNVVAAPQFVDLNGQPYHLSDVSPCVDTGGAQRAPTNDLKGIYRPLDGDADHTESYDMGCYEQASFGADHDGDGVSDGDEVYVYGCNVNAEDTDGDGLSDGGEVIAGSDPADGNDVFGCAGADGPQGGAGFIVSWGGLTGRLYTVRTAADLAGAWSNVVDCTEMTGVAGMMSCTGAPSAGQFFAVDVRMDE
ncbi:MAG: PKD domain-containing protein [Verrucomicrobia bacterium]|nr:PKD domain-containing protein [Verrucomicrobiota bacterium]